MKNLFKSIISSSLFLCLSAQAKTCPSGYSDGDSEILKSTIYITYNGSTYDCRGDNPGMNCGNGIFLENPPNMEVSITSREGIRYNFFGNNAHLNGKSSNTKDCSFGSYCISRWTETNIASPRNKDINFNVLITWDRSFKTKCNKLSF